MRGDHTLSKIGKLLRKVTDKDISTALIVKDGGLYRAYPPDYMIFERNYEDGQIEQWDFKSFAKLKEAIEMYAYMRPCKDADCCRCIRTIRRKQDERLAFTCS
jgi:hypothetical protein